MIRIAAVVCLFFSFFFGGIEFLFRARLNLTLTLMLSNTTLIGL